MKKEQSNKEIKMGKFLSLVLRHNPSAANIELDKNGWANVDELISGVNSTGRYLDKDLLDRIVKNNNKSRYSYSDDKKKIRANQGHSLDVDVELVQTTPPDILYHGTASRFVDSIIEKGLIKGNRQHVHMSSDMVTAVDVGKRHGKPVVIKIDAKKMAEDGYIFYESANHVWLCESVPKKYISIEK